MTINDTTETGICQFALTLIGGGDIDSISDPQTGLEAICGTLYKPTIETLLARKWNWVDAEMELPKDPSVTPLKDFRHAHRLPGNMLAGPFAVRGNGLRLGAGEWRVMGDYLYSNYETVRVDYNRKPPVIIWPSYFVNLAGHAMAVALAVPVGVPDSVHDKFSRITYGPPEMMGQGGLYGIARNLDAQSKPTRSMFANGDPFTRARFGGA